MTPDELFDLIAREAVDESPLWRSALRDPGERSAEPVFSPLGEARFALAVESIYEGYLLHHGRPRLFLPEDFDQAVLLGDYLYAHGLVRLASLGDVAAVADLAELISLCSQLRAESAPGDGVVWAATAACLGDGSGQLERARAASRLERDTGPLEGLARASVGDDALALALRAHERHAF
ncbi:MAG: hypothetical protein R3C15_12425 [Thermoleophilia bacterium]